ncbi:MAG: IS66 family insertion sequence element accessory protein TnpB, partial [Deltaproteobacteria bacterium]|nr:IS66 family insertion sequence element accessory protein TnpB [Deltaproteobacteria bacterium]
MRRSFDCLVAVARDELAIDVLRTPSVLYFNRSRTHCKLLFHDATGFVIVTKRMDDRRFVAPHAVSPNERSVAIEMRTLSSFLAGEPRTRSIALAMEFALNTLLMGALQERQERTRSARPRCHP